MPSVVWRGDFVRIWITLGFAMFCAVGSAQDVPRHSNAPNPSGTPAQAEVANIEEHKKLIALWHDRAEGFTNASLEDQWELHFLQPMLEARLAQAWWKIDPQRAHAWLLSAVENAIHDSKSVPEDFRDQNLRAAEGVYRICKYLKQDEAAQKVLDALLAAAKAKGYNPKRHNSAVISSLSSSIMVAATEIARDDPARAADMANLLIQFHSPQIALIIDWVGAKDPQTAERLFAAALQTADDSQDYPMMYSLMQYGFPYFSNPTRASDTEKSLILEKAGEMLSQPLTSDSDRQDFCREGGMIAEHLLSNFPPAQQGLIQASLQSCPPKAEADEDAGDPNKCDTADACLKLLDTAKTDEQRARLKSLAATDARGEKDPVRALSILDSLTAEEREWVPDWKNDYEMYGMDAMQQLYGLHDSQTIQRIIDRAPDDLRGKMVLSLVEVPGVRKDHPYAVTTLSEARRTLEKSPSGNPTTYLELCNDYAELLPEEAPQVFGFAVVQLNHIEYQDFEKERKEKLAVNKERPAFGYYKPGLWLQPIDIRGSLMDNDEPYISAAIKTIKDPETRLSMRISFLRYALKRYEEELNKPVAAPRVRAAAGPNGGPK